MFYNDPPAAERLQALGWTHLKTQPGDGLPRWQLVDGGLALRSDPCQRPLRVDFVHGPLDHRRRQGGGPGQAIARACGLRHGARPHILDATAGLGRDAFVLASLGCRVDLLERSPVAGALLADGLARAAQAEDAELRTIIARMGLQRGDALEILQGLCQDHYPQVISLDPMFPERSKSALVRKEMRIFQALVGDDPDAPQLLELARIRARQRVVVKRPARARPLGGYPPDFTIPGKTIRFDVYRGRN